MPTSRRLELAVAVAVALALDVSLCSAVAAADEAGPPPGWEVPPPLVALSPRAKPAAPACCAHDVTCCQRQMDLDTSTPSRVLGVVEVSASELPNIVVKTA